MESQGKKPFENKFRIILDPKKEPSGTKSTKKPGTQDDLKNDIGIPSIEWMEGEKLSDFVENYNEYDAILPKGDMLYNPVLESLMSDSKANGEDEIVKRVFGQGLLYLGLTLKREAELFESLDIDIDEMVRKILRANSGFIVPIANLLTQYITE